MQCVMDSFALTWSLIFSTSTDWCVALLQRALVDLSCIQ